MKINFQSILGKHILIGITLLNENQEIIDKFQFHGIIEYAKKDEMIGVRSNTKIDKYPVIKDENGLYILPPDLNAINTAVNGIYTLHSTGEKVENPDLVASWTITTPKIH